MPPSVTEDDPVLAAEVEHAIAPYRALLPPEMLEVLRAAVIKGYLEHPTGQRILHHLRAGTKVTNESGEVPVADRDAPAKQAVVKPLAPRIARGKGR